MAEAEWELCSVPPGSASEPAELARLGLEWWPARVPGTAASSLRDLLGIDPDGWDYDARDWWYHTKFPGVSGPRLLYLGGLATIADVWLNGHHVLHSENMFLGHALDVTAIRGDNELYIRFSALGPELEQQRPRPRWRTPILSQRNLRWIRTSLLGRVPGWSLTPAPVGPWRPIELRPSTVPRVLAKAVVTECDGGGGGSVLVRVLVANSPAEGGATLEVGTHRAPMTRTDDGRHAVVDGMVRLDRVERWWPATHGDQPLYPVSILFDQHRIDLGRVGFRTIDVDDSDGGFTVLVNGVKIFCRGATWWPTDPVAASSPPAEMRATLGLARAANMNMIRVSGMGTYETEEFWTACDELGLLVWQDCMLAFSDPPDDQDFVRQVEAELEENLARIGGHPALAVVCGSLQVHAQAAINGGYTDPPDCPVLDSSIPKLVDRLLPGVPYIPSAPTGGAQPFFVDEGVSHYYGVGMYLRDPADARHSGVRFAAECLMMATPPEPATVDRLCGGAVRAGHHPEWKRAVHTDPGRGWDMEDLREYYAKRLLDVDPVMMRLTDPERALDAGRASNAELVTQVFTEWRRVGSVCEGGLIMGLRDQRLGAGWGLIDAAGVPKSTWYALARVAAPIAVLITDEGLQGLAVHVLNDTGSDFGGRLRLEMFARREVKVADEEMDVNVAPRSGVAITDTALLGGFRDASYAYRFGPPQHDTVVATLTDGYGSYVSQAFHFPQGLSLPLESDLGLQARVGHGPDGSWLLAVATRKLAQWVVPTIAGYRASDSWFHIAPGSERRLLLQPVIPGVGAPQGSVRAWNSEVSVAITGA